MSTRKQIILPQHQKLLAEMGENFKIARKRRRLTTLQVAERADISRSTLYLIEKALQWELILKSFMFFDSTRISVN